jgi:hypothetical protein
MIRQIRVFILIDESKESLTIGKLMFYPKVNIPLRKIKISQPSALTSNEILEKIKNRVDFSKDLIFGYISLNGARNGNS